MKKEILIEEQQKLLSEYLAAKNNGEKIIVLSGLQQNSPKIRAKSSDGLRYSDEESRRRYKKIKEKEKIENDIKTRVIEDKFIWMIYKLYQDVNKHKEILTTSDLTRLIYISTFLDWNGRLMLNEKTTMSKSDLKIKLKLSKNRFNDLFNKLTSLKIIIEHSEKRNKEKIYYINPDYFFKGEIDKSILVDNQRCTRLFAKEIQSLYEKTTAKSHKTLSLLFRTIPYLNIKYNIVCKNPEETCADLIQPLSMKELAEILGYSERRIKDLKSEFTNIKTIEKRYVISFANSQKDIRYAKIIVNPKVIYSGSDSNLVEGFKPLF